MLVIVLVVAASVALAIIGYANQGWRHQWLPVAFRTIAWSALGLLLLNPGCPSETAARRPLVLLDASLSMQAAGGAWRAAADSAHHWGDVRPFGDPDRQLDSVPDAGTSRLSEALAAARATGRPVIVATDGAVEDASGLPPDPEMAIRIFPRAVSAAAAVSRVEAPGRLTARDTLVVRVAVRALGLGARKLPLTLTLEGRELARATADVEGDGEADVTLQVPPGRIAVGEHLLTVSIADSVDVERRDDARAILLAVSAVPGVVLLASPADWDARFLLKALQQVADLPVAGFARLERSGWRRMADLSPAGEAEVKQVATKADLLVLRGEPLTGLTRRPRAVLELPGAAATGERTGDWYVAAGPSGPTPGALVGFSLDSFPPATAVEAPPADTPSWVGLTAQLGRRGTPRPVLTGFAGPGGRRAVLSADGLWRWAFRGGASEQAYRAIVASTIDWLLAVPDSVRGSAVPVRSVVPNGRPIVFERAATDSMSALGISILADDGSARLDTLRFGPDGRAALRLPVGAYRYELQGRGRGRVVVEMWSPEWFPGPITLEARDGAPAVEKSARGLREAWWIYALGILALCGEWLVRRRRGLR